MHISVFGRQTKSKDVKKTKTFQARQNEHNGHACTINSNSSRKPHSNATLWCICIV